MSSNAFLSFESCEIDSSITCFRMFQIYVFRWPDHFCQNDFRSELQVSGS